MAFKTSTDITIESVQNLLRENCTVLSHSEI